MEDEKTKLLKDEQDPDSNPNEQVSITIQSTAPVDRNQRISVLIKYIHTSSLVFLTIQQILQPLLVREAHHRADKTGSPVVGSTIVLITELIRLAFCSLHVLVNQKSISSFGNVILRAFTQNKKETFKVCIPALIYVVQNNLYYLALKRLDATLFSISYQLRILTTAILMVLILRKLFSITQWGALFISLSGVVCVQISSKKVIDETTETKKNQADYILGLTIVFVMCWMSAFAGVFLEKVFKNSSCDIWLQNIRLSIITLPFAVLTATHDHQVLRKHGFFYGWTNLIWIIAFSSAIGGVIVSAVMKYADNIKKSYCQSIALGGTALISVLIGDSKATVLLFTGVGLVILSVFLYSLFPPAESTKNRPITIASFPQSMADGVSFDPYEWESYFFGNITREASENILKLCDVGTFLVRPSTTQVNGYSLSVRELSSGPKQIFHYLIEPVEDDDGKSKFSINGRSYSDMSNLISYFKMHKLEHVNLRIPAPKTPLKEVIAVHRFEGQRVTDLSFERDEVLDILRIPEEGWWIARNALGTIGLIPSNYVKERKAGEDSASSSSSYRHSTNSLLSDQKNYENLAIPAVVKVISSRRPSAYDVEALPLKIGDLIVVTEVQSNGICRGTLLNNGAKTVSGTFPISYVAWTTMPVPESPPSRQTTTSS